MNAFDCREDQTKRRTLSEPVAQDLQEFFQPLFLFLIHLDRTNLAPLRVLPQG